MQVKKIIYQALAVCVLLLMAGATAQAEGYRRPVVLVNYFTNAGSLSDNEVELARSCMMSSMKNVSRFQVVDIATDAAISEEVKRRMSEAALADELARSGEMKQLGADFIMEVTLSDLSVSWETNKEGKTHYSGKMTYGIKFISTADGTIAASGTYSAMGAYQQTDAQARTRTLSDVLIGRDIIEEVYPLEGVLVDVDYTIKKDEMKTCYIELGTDHGVYKGQFFDVVGVQYRAGRAVYKPIGIIKVTEVVAGDLSECKVTSGGKEILAAVKDYMKQKAEDEATARPLKVKSRASSGSVMDRAGKGLSRGIGAVNSFLSN